MTLEDLVRRFRVLSGDREQPYFWDAADLADWFTDAERQACIRGRLLRDDSTQSVCQIALTPGTRTYRLHKSVYELISVRLLPASGERPRMMRLHSREWLDQHRPDWRAGDCPADAVVQDDTRIHVVGSFEAGDKLLLECYRTPLRPLQDFGDAPEIHEAHHEHLILWALHKAFSVVDAETLDAQRSAAAEASFTRYFGPMPDSDLRRITRHDEPHHNDMVLP